MKFLWNFDKNDFSHKKFQGFENLYFVSIHRLVVFTKSVVSDPFRPRRDFLGLKKWYSSTLPFRPSILKSCLKIFLHNFSKFLWIFFVTIFWVKNFEEPQKVTCKVMLLQLLLIRTLIEIVKNRFKKSQKSWNFDKFLVLGPVPNFIEKSRKLLGISKLPDPKNDRKCERDCNFCIFDDLDHCGLKLFWDCGNFFTFRHKFFKTVFLSHRTKIGLK